MNVFRIHIRPSGGKADIYTTFDYCLKNMVLGVGWGTTSRRNTSNWDEYYQEASHIHSDLQVCEYIRTWVKDGDLVWTRDPNGKYYLALVTSGWEYWTTPESIEKDIDVENIFRCVLRPVDIDEVPGKVVACFRARRTIQRIGDSKAGEYSKHLWNKLSDERLFEVDKSQYSDIFMMLDDEETEDLLFLYLQYKGWYVLPNSRKSDTMSFEYLLVDAKTDERAAVQVKTGEAVIDQDRYSSHQHKVFLFQSNERYSGLGAAHIVRVSREELMHFLEEAIHWLPRTFQRKMEIVRQD